MPSKLSRLGLLDPAFDVMPLREMIDKNDAGSWGSDPLDVSMNVLRSTNFNDTGYLDLSDVAKRFLEPVVFDALKLEENEILIERSGGSETQPVGRVSFITKDVAEQGFAYANFIQRISVKSGIDPKYLFYCLYQMHSAGSTQIMQNQTNGIRNLEYRFFLKQLLPKPEFTEQQKIASILSSVDDTIKATRTSIAKLERLKKSLMQNLLTGKMKPDGSWRKENKFYLDEKFGKVPVGWKFGRLSEIAQIEAGQSPPGEYYNQLGQGVPILNGPAEFTDRFPIPVQYTTKVTKLARPGDILFCVRGSTTGRMNFADQEYCIGRGIAAIRPSQDYEISFLYYTLLIIVEKLFAIAKSSGTTFPNVNRDELKKKAILYPEDLSVRNEIAGYFCSIDKLIEEKIMKISKLEKLKKSLMQKLLTGQVRVR